MKSSSITLALILATNLFGADWYVSVSGTVSDDCSVANPCKYIKAISSSADNDDIYFGAGTYTSSVEYIIYIDKNISILGGWDGSSTKIRNSTLYTSILDGSSTRRGVLIDEDHNVTIDGFTIQNCQTDSDGAGLLDINSSYIYIKDVIFQENYALNTSISDIIGGGAYIEGGKVIIEDSQFIKNSAKSILTSRGGGLALEYTDANLTSVIFQENDAQSDSSALYVKGKTPMSEYPIDIDSCQFIDNSKETSVSASGNKKGTVSFIYNWVSIVDTLFQGNDDTSGHTVNSDHGDIYLINSKILNNAADDSILSVYDGILYLFNSIIADNNITGSDSEALRVQSVNGYIFFNTFASNIADKAIQIGAKGSTDNLIFNSNIIVDHTLGIQVDSASTVDINNTLWGEGTWANDTNISGTGTITHENDYSGDPAFVDANNSDYHIKINSVAKDIGVASIHIGSVDLNVTSDIDGDERPFGRAADIGADECVDVGVNPSIIMYLLN